VHVGRTARSVRQPFRLISLGNRRALPVLVFGISTHAQVLRLRRRRPHLAVAVLALLPSPRLNRIGLRDLGISELNGWPALTTRADASTKVVTDLRLPWVVEVTGFVFFVGLFHSQFQTGLSRRTQYITFVPCTWPKIFVEIVPRPVLKRSRQQLAISRQPDGLRGLVLW